MYMIISNDLSIIYKCVYSPDWHQDPSSQSAWPEHDNCPTCRNMTTTTSVSDPDTVRMTPDIPRISAGPSNTCSPQGNSSGTGLDMHHVSLHVYWGTSLFHLLYWPRQIWSLWELWHCHLHQIQSSNHQTWHPGKNNNWPSSLRSDHKTLLIGKIQAKMKDNDIPLRFYIILSPW